MAIKMFKQLRRRRKQGSIGSQASKQREASESGESSTTVSRKNFFGLSKTPSVRSHPSVSHSSPDQSANDESLQSRTISQPRGNLSIGSVGSLTASTKDSTAPKKVQFTEIKFREYERVLDNNPSCSSGAPVGLGWKYSSESKIAIDEYEDSRPVRRTQVDLVLTRQEREEILLEWGAQFNEIVDAIRTNIRIKNQRRHTINTLGRYDKWEERMESAGRKLKRTVLFQKPTSQRAKEMGDRVQPVVLEIKSAEHHHHAHQQQMYAEAQRSSTGEDSKENGATNAAAQMIPTSGETHETNGSEGLQHEAAGSNPNVVIRQSSATGSELMAADGPLLEIDIYDTADVESRISFEETLMYEQYGGRSHSGRSFSSYGDDDSYSSEGFRLLVRDTRHWTVDHGNGAPQVNRRFIPTIISEDDICAPPIGQPQMPQIFLDDQGRPFILGPDGRMVFIDPQSIPMADPSANNFGQQNVSADVYFLNQVFGAPPQTGSGLETTEEDPAIMDNSPRMSPQPSPSQFDNDQIQYQGYGRRSPPSAPYSNNAMIQAWE